MLLLLTGIGAGGALVYAGREPDLLASLTQAAHGYGSDSVRLSVVSTFRPCPAGSGCTPRIGRRTVALVRRLEAAAQAGMDPDALHAAALVSLLFSTGSGNQLDQSISYLQSAAAMVDRPAPILADLAGAHLLRASRMGAPRELFLALDAAERALEAEPGNLPARFNAAQALDRIGLRAGAAATWTAYLAADSTSGWADHARRRLRALASLPSRAERPEQMASPAALTAFAAAAPQEARELGWDVLLPEWSSAVLAGDGMNARRRLNDASVLGEALASRGGDRSLIDAVHLIRARVRDDTGTLRLATLHRLLGQARAAQREARLNNACSVYRQIGVEADPGPLREWSATLAGLCAANTLGTDPDALWELAARSDSSRYPAMTARRWWGAGLALRRAARYDRALEAFSRAETLSHRLGEREYAAGVRTQRGNAYALLGDMDDAYALLHASAAELGGYPGHLLYNNLYALRNATLADGLGHAARLIQDEAVGAVARMSPFHRAEALLARVRLNLTAGRSYAPGDMATALVLIDSVDDAALHASILADLHEAQGLVHLAKDPAEAEKDMDFVVDHFPQPDRLVPALFTRAEARLAAGDRERALVDLRHAVELLDKHRTQLESAQLRASLLERSRRVFDRAVALCVAGGHIEEALDFVERSRASFSPVGHTDEWTRRPLRAPRGQTVLALALVGDTLLLAWTLWDGGMHLTPTRVDRAELGRTVESIRSALERSAPESTVKPALQTLYDQLIRPVRARLGPPGTPLVIVADGELAALPVAALHDRTRNRYLVQDYTVRFTSSLRDPSLAGAPLPSGMPVTVVADPAFDALAFPEFQRLPGSFTEAAQVRSHYARAQQLAGLRANAGSLRQAFERGGIAHFAGHAVFDDARPERSFLLGAGGRTDGRVTAADIARMELSGLRLVVLSACQTSRAVGGRSGGFAGLAGAFLAAGAGGVVGSLWRVDDRQTQVLMDAFHGAYRLTGDAAGSLRHAQLELLRSPDPTLRSPAAWAGFRYTGG